MGFAGIFTLTQSPDVRKVQEGSTVQADVHEGRLHSRQYPGNAAIVYIANNSAAAGTLYMKLLHRSLFNEGNTGFLWSDIDENLTVHKGVCQDLLQVWGNIFIPDSSSNCAVSNNGNPTTPL